MLVGVGALRNPKAGVHFKTMTAKLLHLDCVRRIFLPLFVLMSMYTVYHTYSISHAVVQLSWPGPVLPVRGSQFSDYYNCTTLLRRVPRFSQNNTCSSSAQLSQFAQFSCGSEFDLIFLQIRFRSSLNTSQKCCGSGMFIPDPTFFYPGSRIRTVSIPDPHQRI